MRFLLFVLLSSAAPAPPQTPLSERPTAGFVRRMAGEWELEVGGRKERIAPGQALPAGALVRLKKAGPAARIEIVRAHAEQFSACRRESDQTLEICEATFTLPDTPGAARLTERLLLVASRFFGSREGTYATPMVRGAAPVLEDGIGVLESGRIDLSRVLKRVPRGTYQLRFTSRPLAPVPPEDAAVISWTMGESSDFLLPGALGPGIYLLSVAELRESAWVLVARPSDVPQLDAAVTDLDSVTAGWGLKAADRKGLRRALLEQLSRDVVRPQR